MRIRSTKPEFWRSERIASVGWDARLVLKGLESYVDDNGVGKDDIALIVGDLFQRDLVREPSRTLARVSEAISELEMNGLLWRYEHDGTNLLYIAFWESVQRVDKPQDGRFPRPDGTWNYKQSIIRESLANPREPSRTLAPGTGEQGNRGTVSTSSADADGESEDTFAAWWSLYPRKVGKGQAVKAYRSALKKATADALAAAVVAQASMLMAKGVDFCPHPATWLNGERWLDETSATAPIERRERSIISERDMRPFEGDPDDAQEWSAWQRSERQRIWRERGEIA